MKTGTPIRCLFFPTSTATKYLTFSMDPNLPTADGNDPDRVVRDVDQSFHMVIGNKEDVVAFAHFL